MSCCFDWFSFALVADSAGVLLFSVDCTCWLFCDISCLPFVATQGWFGFYILRIFTTCTTISGYFWMCAVLRLNDLAVGVVVIVSFWWICIYSFDIVTACICTMILCSPHSFTCRISTTIFY